ncbi:sulfatase-like hydrolase/transferase [Gelidibacter sp. F2691]|nr:sulfatase-like hydrolase/transferase [Gelidibacter sp. F2691]
MSKIFPTRFALLKAFLGLFLMLSFVVRLSFLIWNFSEVDKGIFVVVNTFLIGFLFDLVTISYLLIPYLIYLVIVPKRLYGSLADRIVTYFGFTLGVLILFFSFFGEVTFWDEFQRRYNFIAVDYLIYTYEVVKNINESYPLPALISGIVVLVTTSFFIVHKQGYFRKTFTSNTPLKPKLIAAMPWMVIAALGTFFVSNTQAEFSKNRFNNELAKAGIYSFFSAFRNNELAYTEFYKTLPTEEAFQILKSSLSNPKTTFVNPNNAAIYRTVVNADSVLKPFNPNVIFICIESLSGDFLKEFGNENNITPTLDSLANQSVFFTNLYATGTRTVRGMEAITLSIPPTPGRSIVKRKNNQGLFTIGEVFKQQGYERNFFYGGDGYFDNMNTFFGGNGFNIIDRGRGFLLDKSIATTRTNIEDNEVTFENAWGVCDTDIYNKVIKEADKAYSTGVPFFDFVMTTSNHKPYTYPEGSIDIPSETGRDGAVKYTDFAIKEFLKDAQQKPWFKNTVVVIMSDHCASSAGRWDLDVKNYHIPALIFNLPDQKPEKVSTLASQIDLFPTLFAALHWDYTSNLFGEDILSMKPDQERAFIGNYRKLGYLKGTDLLILDEQAHADYYTWNPFDNSLKAKSSIAEFQKESIAFYQVANDLYSNGGLKLKVE